MVKYGRSPTRRLAQLMPKLGVKMPLTKKDRRFLAAIDRLKLFLLIVAALTLVFILLTPPSQIQMVTTVLGVALCGVFYMTQRLLACITNLDFEISRLSDVIKSTLTKEERKSLFPDDDD